MNFQETVKQKTDWELEIISKDYVFYSEDERLVALNELETRGRITKELSGTKKDLELEKEIEEDEKKPSYKISFKDLFPQKNYIFTPVLIYVNVLIFIVMMLFGQNLSKPDIAVQWGGNIRHLSINGQIWRLFTSIFLHSGFIHLAFNMFALLYVGSLLEKILGKKQFIFAYVISGIGASVSSLMMHENIVSIGASGAIFGLFGLLFPILGKKEGRLLNISIDKMMFYCSAFLLDSIISGFTNSGIDNAAHVGGLLSGIIVGLFYSLMMNHKIRPMPILTTITLILGIFSTIIITKVSDKTGDFNRALKVFLSNEQKASQVYRINDFQTIFYNLNMPIEDVKKVEDAVKQLKVYFPVHQRLDIIFLNNNNNYSLKLFVSKNLWQEPAIIERLKWTVDYIKKYGIEKPINLVLIDNQTFEEKQVKN